MQPVPETREVRRTVRVAVALVVGQVLLIAVIGWVTVSYSRGRAHRDSAAVDQMAAPPATVATSPSRPAPSPNPVPTPRSSRKHSTRQVDPVPPGTDQPAIEVTTGSPRMPDPDPAARVAPVTTSASAPIVLVPPVGPDASPSPAASPTPTDVVEEPVVPGTACDRLGARGRTADAVDVLCLPDRQGRLRWKIV